MDKMPITLPMLHDLRYCAQRNGTPDEFSTVALAWAGGE